MRTEIAPDPWPRLAQLRKARIPTVLRRPRAWACRGANAHFYTAERSDWRRGRSKHQGGEETPPVGSKPRKPCGAALSAPQCGAQRPPMDGWRSLAWVTRTSEEAEDRSPKRTALDSLPSWGGKSTPSASALGASPGREGDQVRILLGLASTWRTQPSQRDHYEP